MKKKIPFVKGTMGGNLIVLLDGPSIPEGEEVESALRALDEWGVTGHQAGLLYPSDEEGHVRVRVVSVSWRSFIPACGGLTQVLGKALVETDLGQRYGVFSPVEGDHEAREHGVVLDFDSWPAPLRIVSHGREVESVETDFTHFVSSCRESGIEPVDLLGVPAYRVHTFLVMDADELAAKHPSVDVQAMDTSTKELLLALHKRFHEITGQESWDFCLYDRNPRHGGDVRAVFPHSIQIGHIEPSCGTGSVAIALALSAREPGEGRLFKLETGGDQGIGGPDLTAVTLETRDGAAVAASLTHDNVKTLARGELLF